MTLPISGAGHLTFLDGFHIGDTLPLALRGHCRAPVACLSEEAVLNPRTRCWHWLFLWLLVLSPSTVQAQDSEEEPETSGLEVIDLGVTDGYIRRPLGLRLRRSITYSWICRGLLLTSETAVVAAWYFGGDGLVLSTYLWPSFAVTAGLLSVSQSRRGLREHRGEPTRPYWRTAGLVALCLGTAWAIGSTDPRNPEAMLASIAFAQLVGVSMIQLQAWRYRRDINGRSWPPWLDLLDRLKTTSLSPVIAPIRGGAIVGAGMTF